MHSISEIQHSDSQSVSHPFSQSSANVVRQAVLQPLSQSGDRKRVHHPLSTGESGRHLGGQKDTVRQPFIQSVNHPVIRHPGRKTDRPTVTWVCDQFVRWTGHQEDRQPPSPSLRHSSYSQWFGQQSRQSNPTCPLPPASDPAGHHNDTGREE